MDIRDYIQTHQQKVERVLRDQLGRRDVPDGQLREAMRYAVFNGGKRLRPVLAYAGARALGADAGCADIPAAAVELIHSYSLIHDDLPAMDDDDLRRGVPTCHIVFGEATAILAGDALQALAFDLLANAERLAVGDRIRLRMLSILSSAVGWRGMVAGQSLDFSASGSFLDERGLAAMHALKTGALIRASVLMGALAAGVATARQLEALGLYADCLGLAFQITDDILDVTSDTRTLGKTQGRDQVLNKPTYPSMLGLDGAERKARELCEQGITAVVGFPEGGEPLKSLAEYIIRRDY